MKKCTTGRLDKVPPSGIRKFFDLIAAWRGSSRWAWRAGFSTPWSITEAAIRSLEKGMTMYTSNAGCQNCAGNSRYSSDVRVEYDPNTELLITNGVSEGWTSPPGHLGSGEEVIMPDPGYVAYPAAVLLADGIPVQVPRTVRTASGCRQ